MEPLDTGAQTLRLLLVSPFKGRFSDVSFIECSLCNPGWLAGWLACYKAGVT